MPESIEILRYLRLQNVFLTLSMASFFLTPLEKIVTVAAFLAGFCPVLVFVNGLGEMMSEVKMYGFKDLMSGMDTIEPSESHMNRRRLAKSLQDIATHIIRMDASEEELASYAKELEHLALRLDSQGKVDSGELFKKMINGEASGDDVLMGHDYSILSGKASAVAFPMDMEIVGDRVKGSAYVPLPYQGPPNRVHGGIVAGMFDVLLARTQMIGGIMGYTAYLNVTYKAATPLETDLQLEAWVEKVEGRKMFNAGKIMANGEVCATAEGLWIQPKSSMFGMG